MKIIFNTNITSLNNLRQNQGIQQQRILITQPDDKFIKQPSFRAHIRVDDFVELYTNAINKKDIPLLKKMIEEDNWQGFKKCRDYFNNFGKEINPLIKSGLHSKNREIRALFSEKNLYNLLSQYRDSANLAIQNGDLFDLAKMYFTRTQDADTRKDIAEEMVYSILNFKHNSNYPWEDIKHDVLNKILPLNKRLAEFPMTDYERYLLRTTESMQLKNVLNLTMQTRLTNIISRNGSNTPENLLNCLNDLTMTPEILDTEYESRKLFYTTRYKLIDKIVNIPVNDKNKEIIAKIAEKLSEMNLPDNETFRNAGVVAAKKGHVEILKAFNSRGIHYMNNLQEPISNFPEDVQEVLKNAKINDYDLTKYIIYPEGIKDYLAAHPNIDINSRDKNGDTLVLKAVREKSSKTIEILAKYDDVDWDVVDKNGDNILTQMIDPTKFLPIVLKNEYTIEFIQELLQFLQKLPKGKFNINHKIYQKGLGFNFQNCIYTHIPIALEEDVLAFPNFNPMLYLTGRGRSLLEIFSKNTKEFKKLVEHPNFDTALLTEKHLLLQSAGINFLSQNCNKQFAKQAQDIYDNNGLLELKEIAQFINYPGFDNIKNHTFNFVKENIAHLLVEILPDITDINKIEEYQKLFEKLKKAEFDFNEKDILGRTPLDKARECENTIAINILMKLSNH